MEKLPNKSYKVKEAAEMLGCSTENIYRMIKYGHLQAFRVGGKANYRITDHDLNDFIERMKTRNQEMHG